MKISSTILGGLRQALGSNAAQHSDDFVLNVPNTLVPSFPLHEPVTAHSTSIPDTTVYGSTVTRGEIMTLAANGNTNKLVLGPGVWELHIVLQKVITGAVAENVASMLIDLVSSHLAGAASVGLFKGSLATEHTVTLRLPWIVPLGTTLTVRQQNFGIVAGTATVQVYLFVYAVRLL